MRRTAHDRPHGVAEDRPRQNPAVAERGHRLKPSAAADQPAEAGGGVAAHQPAEAGGGVAAHQKSVAEDRPRQNPAVADGGVAAHQ